jgi:membrane protein required for colicin V production
MEGFTLVDGAVALLILVSGILAYARGLIREVLAILGWVVAAVGAFALAPVAQPWIAEIPYVGPMLAGSCELTVIAAFALAFAVLLMVVALFTPLFSSLIRNSALGGIDQALGFFFGILRGVVLVAVALVVYQRAVPANTVPMIDQSRSVGIFAQVTDQLVAALPANAPEWIVAQYDTLTASCRRN